MRVCGQDRTKTHSGPVGHLEGSGRQYRWTSNERWAESPRPAARCIRVPKLDRIDVSRDIPRLVADGARVAVRCSRGSCERFSVGDPSSSMLGSPWAESTIHGV